MTVVVTSCMEELNSVGLIRVDMATQMVAPMRVEDSLVAIPRLLHWDRLARTPCSFAIKPPEGIYKDATFNFSFNVPQGYPYDPPKVLSCTAWH